MTSKKYDRVKIKKNKKIACNNINRIYKQYL
jgi:hypothetical protein